MISSPSRRIRIIDTTLRDGAQTPGIAFSREQKIAVARLLDKAGVDELEAGTPVMGKAEQEDLLALMDLGLACRITGWCRARREDLHQARACGLTSIHFGVPVSDIQLGAMGKSRAWVMEQIGGLIATAAEQFDQVSVGAQDATRCDPEFLVAAAEAAAGAGACRFRLADTVGVAHPLEVAGLVKALCAAVAGIDIEFHAHNDLGMATANAVTAATAGAGALSVTVNGLGERAGNAALEEVAAALWRCHAGHCGIRLEQMTALCRTVASLCHRPLPPAKPVVGEGVFLHESGIHCDGVLKNPATFEPFPPARVGQSPSRLAAGTHSGSAGIRHLFSRLGIAVDNQTAAVLRPAVQRAARGKAGLLTADDLLEIYRSTCHGGVKKPGPKGPVLVDP